MTETAPDVKPVPDAGASGEEGMQALFDMSAPQPNYRALLELFGLSGHDYKRFLNFLAAHDCGADFREFRSGLPHTPRQAGPVLAKSRMAKTTLDPKRQALTDTGT